jgi:phosphohistidine phosphatase
MIDIVRSIDDGFDRVMLVGHNPGLTDLAERLSGSPVDNIPTAGILAIDFEVDSWRDIGDHPGGTAFFDYPKKPKSS